MSRGFVIQGESMVSLRFGDHLNSYLAGLDSENTNTAGVDQDFNSYDLGLALEEITVTPKFFHHDILVDDFGDVPPETLWMMGEVGIQMVLMHYDQYVLDAALGESMGGLNPGNSAPFLLAGGHLSPAGTPMGGGVHLYGSGCHYMGLSISPQQSAIAGLGSDVWRFPACYLAAAPVEMKFSTKCTGILCSWRSIPYAFPRKPTHEVLSSGVTLWDHEVI